MCLTNPSIILSYAYQECPKTSIEFFHYLKKKLLPWFLHFSSVYRLHETYPLALTLTNSIMLISQGQIQCLFLSLFTT